MMDEDDFEYDFKRWNCHKEEWEPTDDEPWDSQHPRLVGIVVDGYSDYLLHGHRYVKGSRFPDWIGVFVHQKTISALGIEPGHRVVMQIFPYRRGVFFGCNFINKLPF